MSKEASPPPSGSVEEENLPPTGRPYMSLIRFVEGLFEQHGDTHSGLGYPKPDHFEDRYKVYLDVMRFGPSTGTAGAHPGHRLRDRLRPR